MACFVFNSIKHGMRLNKSCYSNLAFCSSSNANLDIKGKLDNLVKNTKVLVFMKGVPDAPRCGFSNAVIQVLRMHGVTYDAIDVLEDETLRQGIKDYSDWPTIPQVYINGEFIGGCDIILQLHQNGELVEKLKNAGIKSSLLDATKK